MKKIKLVSSFILVVCILICACTSHSEPQKVNNQVTIFFRNIPSKWKSTENNPIISSEAEYVDDNFIRHQFIPDPQKQFDTLIIPTTRKTVEIKHSYRTIDSFSFIFLKGDSVIITYNEKTPEVKIINRNTKAYDLTYEHLKREKINHNDFPSYIKFKQPIIFADYSKGMEGAEEKVQNSAIKTFAQEEKEERTLLDSLKKSDLISDDVYRFYQAQLLFQQKNIELQLKLGIHSIKPLYKRLTAEDFNIQLGYNKELGWVNGGNMLDDKNDSLLYFSYYNEIVNWINNNYLSRKVGRIRSTNYVNNIATAGSNLPDYTALADTIFKNDLLSTRTKNILLFENIQNIIENRSIDEAKKAFEKFKAEVNDSIFVNFIRTKYSLDSVNTDEKNDLKLVSLNSEHISYNDLIKKHNGSVIYVDFWGSYCSPCIKQFPFSSKLKELYSGKKLVQIYISHERDKKNWKSACEKYNIEQESYFVENRYTSKQLENLNIKYIPHYLIYNKQGKLVEEFAPRPDDKKLINLLDRYLLDKQE